MGSGWNQFGLHFSCLFALILLSRPQGGCSINPEGLALLEFRTQVTSDPYGAFVNWNPDDVDPCMWRGVHCADGKVQILDLNGLSLEGTLTAELKELVHLRSLVLNKNRFCGALPKELGDLTKLELLDLRNNNFSGIIPAEIGRMLSLNHLLLCDNKFEGSVPPELRRLNLCSKMQFDDKLTHTMVTGASCMSRKLGYCVWQNSLKHLRKANTLILPIKVALARYFNPLPLSLFKFGSDSLHGHGDNCYTNLSSQYQPHIQNVQNLVNFARRKLLDQSSNLPAAPVGGGFASQQIITLPSMGSSGAFPAVPSSKKKSPPPADDGSLQTNTSNPVSREPTNQPPSDHHTSGHIWKYIIICSGVAIVLIIAASMFIMCRRRGVTAIGPWKTGLSGQLQKAFITGVPKLNRPELETACEDFSNIIDTLDGCTMYKGTLSSGVEIAVASTAISSSKDWSKNSELAYRKKVDTLSRVNHKNFVNLLGYCEEDEPFARMMVFEYAPNGTLSEHLHVKEAEHLDWNARMRIIMGTAYCLQYMHHDLNPPVSHSNLNSTAIYLTDDYAAKIGEVCVSPDSHTKRISGNDHSDHSVLPPLADPETNIYSFGILLLEIISGKLPCSEDQGSVVNWAAEYLNDKRSISYMIDPTLKSFKNNELDVICEVIQDCIQPDPRHRPTMKDIISKLREVIAISPDQAVPRLSPLWWAELEILSGETT